MNADNDRAADDALLMLKIRSETLAGDLDRVRTFLEKTPRRRDRIVMLQMKLTELRDAVGNVDVKVYASYGVLADEGGQDPPNKLNDAKARIVYLQRKVSEAAEGLQSLLTETKSVKAAVKEIRDLVDDMQQNCFQIEPDEAIAKVLNGDLTERIKKPTDHLSALNLLLTTNQSDFVAWNKFREASKESQAIFAEYVDFLSGLALRDAGFDESISRMAEYLIRTYKTNRAPIYEWMALPTTGRETVAKTLARIIRVGFPEWTVWALPFTAHAFWHVTARHDFAGDLPDIPERFQTCLADAFATYTMGPAYAYACFFLSLNPLEPYEADPQPSSKSGAATTLVGDDTRATAILTMLDEMSAQSQADTGYQPIRERLSAMWTAAMSRAHAKEPTAQAANDSAEIKAIVKRLHKVLVGCECASFLTVQYRSVGFPRRSARSASDSDRRTAWRPERPVGRPSRFTRPGYQEHR